MSSREMLPQAASRALKNFIMCWSSSETYVKTLHPKLYSSWVERDYLYEKPLTGNIPQSRPPRFFRLILCTDYCPRNPSPSWQARALLFRPAYRPCQGWAVIVSQAVSPIIYARNQTSVGNNILAVNLLRFPPWPHLLSSSPLPIQIPVALQIKTLRVGNFAQTSYSGNVSSPRMRFAGPFTSMTIRLRKEKALNLKSCTRIWD